MINETDFTTLQESTINEWLDNARDTEYDYVIVQQSRFNYKYSALFARTLADVAEKVAGVNASHLHNLHGVYGVATGLLCVPMPVNITGDANPAAIRQRLIAALNAQKAAYHTAPGQMKGLHASRALGLLDAIEIVYGDVHWCKEARKQYSGYALDAGAEPPVQLMIEEPEPEPGTPPVHKLIRTGNGFGICAACYWQTKDAPSDEVLRQRFESAHVFTEGKTEPA